MMTPCDVDYALQTLMSKIKERELESQRALSEHDVANRLLKLQLQELQNKLKEKDYQLADANETIRALRSVTQIITGLQDEIRALRTQLLSSHAHKHRLVATQVQNPEVLASPIRTQTSDDITHHTLDDMAHHTLFHPAEAGPVGPDYITQNSTQERTLLKLISDCGRTTDVAVAGVKQEEQEGEMDEGEAGGLEGRGPEEGRSPEEAVKVEMENNSQWDGAFEYSHAESAAVQSAIKSRKRLLMETSLYSHSASVTLIDPVSDRSEDEGEEIVMLPPSKKATLNDDIVTAFKEWPSFVKTLKDLVTAMKIPSASPVLPLDTSFSEPPASTPTREMVQLPGGLSIPKRMYDRLSRSKMSLFAQELAVVIFGRDTLAKCSLTGRKTNKSPLDPTKVNAIIDAVIGHFPGTSPSEIRAVLRRKCNNESFALKGQSVDMGVRPGRCRIFSTDTDYDI